MRVCSLGGSAGDCTPKKQRLHRINDLHRHTERRTMMTMVTGRRWRISWIRIGRLCKKRDARVRYSNWSRCMVVCVCEIRLFACTVGLFEWILLGAVSIANLVGSLFRRRLSAAQVLCGNAGWMSTHTTTTTDERTEPHTQTHLYVRPLESRNRDVARNTITLVC